MDERSDDPQGDSGAANARLSAWNAGSTRAGSTFASTVAPEAEFAYAAANSMVSLAAAEDQVRGCILLNGDFGDTIWVANAAKVGRPPQQNLVAV